MIVSRFDRFWTALAFVLGTVVLFGPMILIPTILEMTREPSGLGHEGVAEATVGVGVILRAAVRRLLRTGVRNVMQTTVGTFARTSVRAATRRVVRIAAKTSMLLFRNPEPSESATDLTATKPTSPIAVAFGLIALSASFAGVLSLVNAEQRSELLPNGDADASSLAVGSAAFWLLSVLGALPMLVYTGVAFLSARWAGVRLSFQTGIDSLLLQAYFTGAGSFLPLTTDSELEGEPRACATAALGNLLVMLGLALGLWGVGQALGNPWISFAASMFLVYAFVFAFPILPLDGGYLFRQNKLLWVAVWGIVLVAFLRLIPESFHAIV